MAKKATSPKPLKKKQRRLAIRDERLQRKPKTKRGRPTKRKRLLSDNEAARLFSETMRTKNRDVRDLLPDVAQLERYHLPLWKTEEDVAEALGVSLKELRFYAIHRRADRFCHYVTFTMPKKNGGERLIMAPKRRLKSMLRKLNELLIHKLPVSDYAHGFRKGRSVRTAAEPHLGKKIIMHLDLTEFFHSVTFGRVRGMFIALGHGYVVATTLAVLMTEAPRQKVETEGALFFVPVDNRRCVQGAPTSPGICSSMALRMDRRLAGLAKKFEFTYTRYVDDLIFSGDDPSCIHRLRQHATHVIEDEGFQVNREKTRFFRSGGCQRVTGVVVNKDLGLSRKERRRLRAMIHRYKQELEKGNEDQERLRYLRGKLAYLHMLNEDQAKKLLEQMPQ